MKNLIKNISLYSIVRILPPLLSFALLPIYTSYTTQAEYGIITSMQVLNSIALVFFVMALDLALFRIYHDYKSKLDRSELLGTIFISIFSISSIILALFFFFSDYVSLIFSSIDFYPYFSLTISYTFLQIFSIIPLIYFQINHKASTYVILSLLSTLTSIGLILFFLIFKDEGAIGFLKGELYGKLVLVPIFIYVTFKIIRFKFSYSKFINTIKFSWPMIPGILSVWVLNLSDRIFIENYFSLEDVAIYSLAYKIASIVLILFGAINMAYNPFFYEIASSKNQIEAKKTLAFINNLFVIISLHMSLFLILFSNNIIDILFDDRYITATSIIPIIVLGCFFSLITGLLNLMFNQMKKSLELMYITLFGAFINLLLNFILIPKFGIYGAAWSTFYSLLIILIIEFIISKNYYYISFDFNKILKGSILIFLSIPIIIFDNSSLQFLFIKLIYVLMCFYFIYKKTIYEYLLMPKKI